MKLNGRCIYDDDDHDVLTVGDVMEQLSKFPADMEVRSFSDTFQIFMLHEGARKVEVARSNAIFSYDFDYWVKAEGQSTCQDGVALVEIERKEVVVI